MVFLTHDILLYWQLDAFPYEQVSLEHDGWVRLTHLSPYSQVNLELHGWVIWW